MVDVDKSLDFFTNIIDKNIDIAIYCFIGLVIIVLLWKAIKDYFPS